MDMDLTHHISLLDMHPLIRWPHTSSQSARQVALGALVRLAVYNSYHKLYPPLIRKLPISHSICDGAHINALCFNPRFQHSYHEFLQEQTPSYR